MPKAATKNATEKTLNIEDLTHATLSERTVRLNLRGDLAAAFDEALRDLADLVSADGRIVSDADDAEERVEELRTRIQDLQSQIHAAERTVRFRGLPDDAWSAFQKEHRSAKGQVLDVPAYAAGLIAACAVEPELTLDEVHALRQSLSGSQMDALFEAATEACTTGGLAQGLTLPSYARVPQPSA